LATKFALAIEPFLTNKFQCDIGKKSDKTVKARCFQLVGIDIFFDANLKPYFIEANS
jgi:D-alanine-D-alanine ligase-like ATP-grasp enzyme